MASSSPGHFCSKLMVLKKVATVLLSLSARAFDGLICLALRLERTLESSRARTFWLLIKLPVKAFFKDDGPAWAAAIAYYSLLSLFPLLLAGVSVASHFVGAKWAVFQATALLGELLPDGHSEIQSIVTRTLDDAHGSEVAFIVPLIWTGTLVFGAVAKALNAVYGATERYSFLKAAVVRLMMLLSLGTVFLLALGSSTFLRLLKLTIGVLPAGREMIAHVVIAVVPALLVLLAFFLAYRFVPIRRPGWSAALIGAIIALIGFVAAKPLFLAYIEAQTRRSIVYGSLNGIVAAMIWAWWVAMIGLFGCQVTFHCQSILFDGKLTSPLDPPRGSP